MMDSVRRLLGNQVDENRQAADWIVLDEKKRANELDWRGPGALGLSFGKNIEDVSMNWIGYALFSAVFAGLTALLAKIGVSNVSSNLATLIRTVVVVVFASGLVAATGELRQVQSLQRRDWAALVASGLATGISWLFYFAALKHGPISGVAPIDKLSFVIAMTLGFLVLKEPVRPLTIAGAGLVVVGVLLTLPSVQEGLGRLFS